MRRRVGNTFRKIWNLSCSAGHFLRTRKKVSFALGAVALFFLADYGVGLMQQNIIAEKAAKKERLENLAFHMIFPDIQDAWDVKGKPEQYEAVI
ncbi:MAG: hypothetical protein P8130_11035, partial [Deltaproteobacteria bacterium]